MDSKGLVFITEAGIRAEDSSSPPPIYASTAAIFPYVAEHPVRGVLIEKMRGEQILSLQCDGGSVICNVPSWILSELERREMLPSHVGSYLREQGFMDTTNT